MANLEPVITVIPKGQTSQAATPPDSREAAVVGGRPIADVLVEAEGDTHRVYLNDASIAKMRQLANRGNDDLGEVADRGYFSLDVSDLRSRDPQDRVRIQVRLTPANEEEERILLQS